MKFSIWTNFWAKLKTFGLDHSFFPTMMDNVALLLRIMTIDIYENSAERIPLFFYIITLIAGVSYFYTYIFSMAWMVFFRYGLSDIQGTAIAIAYGTCSVTCLTKFIFMILYAKELRITVQKFLKCDSQVIPNTRFSKNLCMKLRVVKKRAIGIWVFLVSNGGIFMIIPFLIPGRHFTVEVYLLYGLEPMLESPNFEIGTCITTLSVGFAVYIMVSVAVYVIVLVGYNEAQLNALSEELIRVWDDSKNFYNHIKHRVNDKVHAVYIQKQIMNEFIRIRLRDIIKFHIANINLLHELDEEFGATMAIEYSIMAVSIIAGLLGGLDNTHLQLPYVIVQIFMDCLAGQRLMDACDNFEKSVYSCQWENFNVSNQRTIHLMLMMSQKTLMLSAGGVSKLNFNFMMIIFKSAYSTYTTLKSTVK
ncbi:uncharacterized protein LOC124537069 [Vanessa cardui]|uniref:uncharacterized protein LOC124537069 n=1 Tax=Vanessa cardui TaxID=171605 RepID=UPI001F13415F|nr:uncharacterized protein LOC124537069 [Vanessa cardui]